MTAIRGMSSRAARVCRAGKCGGGNGSVRVLPSHLPSGRTAAAAEASCSTSSAATSSQPFMAYKLQVPLVQVDLAVEKKEEVFVTSDMTRLLDQTVYAGLKGTTKKKKASTQKQNTEQPQGTPPPRVDPDGDDDFYVRAGRAIRALSEDLPRTFSANHKQDLSIFRDDLTFVDEFTSPNKPSVSLGKQAYERLQWAVRTHGNVLCSSIRLEVVRMWQPQDKTISVRWTIKATPRLIGSFSPKPFFIDGLSEFKLDDEGRVYAHKVSRRDFNLSQFSLGQRIKDFVPVNDHQGPMPC